MFIWHPYSSECDESAKCIFSEFLKLEKNLNVQNIFEKK